MNSFFRLQRWYSIFKKVKQLFHRAISGDKLRIRAVQRECGLQKSSSNLFAQLSGSANSSTTLHEMYPIPEKVRRE
jgi:hypothetical protein